MTTIQRLKAAIKQVGGKHVTNVRTFSDYDDMGEMCHEVVVDLDGQINSHEMMMGVVKRVVVAQAYCAMKRITFIIGEGE